MKNNNAPKPSSSRSWSPTNSANVSTNNVCSSLNGDKKAKLETCDSKNEDLVKDQDPVEGWKQYCGSGTQNCVKMA